MPAGPEAATARLTGLAGGGKRALADALARIEAAPRAEETTTLLDAAFAAPRGIALGLTGPPGVGKSTLIDAIIRTWRAEGHSIAVIAVDPSSTRSGGALLGDRTRLSTDPTDPGVFVRSMAARDRLGGIAEITYPALVLMRAFYDLVIVETVGVGQSETGVAEITDLTAFCAQPGSGDALQYMKAGIMEVPDLVIVTKSDMGVLAERTAADLRGALSLGGGKAVPVLRCAAATGEGISEVVAEISRHAIQISPDSSDRRQEQMIRWAEDQVSGLFGRVGLDVARKMGVRNLHNAPFTETSHLISRLSAAISAAFK